VATGPNFGAGRCPFTDSITADPSGNLYFGGACGDVFEMATRGGQPATFAAPTIVVTLPMSTALTGIAYYEGTLAVASYYYGTISLVRGNSVIAGSWVSGLSYPRGMTYDASGNLYVAGGASFCSAPHGLRRAACSVVPGSVPAVTGGVLTRIDPSGNATVLATGLDVTSDVALDPTGNLFATQIYVGNVITLAAQTAGPSVLASEVSTHSGTSLSATWTGAPGATSFTCTLLYGFDAPSTFTATTTGHSCTFSGLDPHALYGVRVVAHYPDGTTSGSTIFANSIQVLNSRIVCARGTSHRVVVGLNPRCPAGWHRL
jgi:hypothetical protein